MTVRNLVRFDDQSTTGLATSGVTAVGFSTSIVKYGSASFRTNPTTTAVAWMRIGGYSSSTPVAANLATNEVWLSFWFYAALLPATAATQEPFLCLTRPGTAQIYFLCVKSDGGIVANEGTAGTLETTLAAAGTIIQGQWHYINLRHNSLAASNITVLKVDGVELYNANPAQDDGTNQIGFVTLGKANNQSGQSVDFYYDGLIISDSAFYDSTWRIGHLLPNSNTANAAWNDGTATSYTEVDDVAMDTTTYIATNAADSGISDFDVEAVTGLNIDGDNIAAVQAHVKLGRFVGLNTDGISIRVISNSAVASASVTPSAAPSASYDRYSRIAEVDPNTSAAWTAAALAGVQVGVEKPSGTTTAFRSTQMWAAVLYKMVSATGNPWNYYAQVA
jgi:hypothetical protein